MMVDSGASETVISDGMVQAVQESGGMSNVRYQLADGSGMDLVHMSKFAIYMSLTPPAA